MNFRQSPREPVERHAQPIGNSDPGSSSPYERAQQLLNAADQAINNALSGNSAAFLESSTQAGGQ